MIRICIGHTHMISLLTMYKDCHLSILYFIKEHNVSFIMQFKILHSPYFAIRLNNVGETDHNGPVNLGYGILLTL